MLCDWTKPNKINEVLPAISRKYKTENKNNPATNYKFVGYSYLLHARIGAPSGAGGSLKIGTRPATSKPPGMKRVVPY